MMVTLEEQCSMERCHDSFLTFQCVLKDIQIAQKKQNFLFSAASMTAIEHVFLMSGAGKIQVPN